MFDADRCHTSTRHFQGSFCLPSLQQLLEVNGMQLKGELRVAAKELRGQLLDSCNCLYTKNLLFRPSSGTLDSCLPTCRL